MDKSVFIKELKKLFIDLNQKEKRYSKVWLSDVDFGGLYYSGKYVLNLKVARPIEGYRSELTYIHDLLDEKVGKEAQVPFLYRFSLYTPNEYALPDRDDIIVYDDELATQAA